MKSPSLGEAVAELNRITASSQAPDSVAMTFFDSVRRTIPYAGIALLSWDHQRAHHVTVAREGYSDSVLTYLRDDFSARDPAWLRMRHVDPRPLRMQDTPYDFFGCRSYLEVLEPAGYKEGMTMCLFSSSGRYTGALHLNVENRRELSTEGREVLHKVQASLADVVNEFQAPEALARTLTPGCAAAVLVDGQWHQLEGRDLHPFSGADGKRLNASVSAALNNRIHEGRFLWLSPESGQLKSIYFVKCGKPTLVAISPDVPEHPFTPREIEVLCKIAEGSSNREIARALARSERTVTTHIEHIMKKLDVTSRVEVATYALRNGLALIDGSPWRGHSASGR